MAISTSPSASTSAESAEFVPGQPLDERSCDPAPKASAVAPKGLITPPGTVLVLRYPSQGGLNVQGWVPLNAIGVRDWYRRELREGVLEIELSNADEVEGWFKRSPRDRQWAGFHAQTACADGSDIYFWVSGTAG